MRQPILCLDEAITALKEIIESVQRERPFEIKAWGILPDHIHAIWELPDGDTDFSTRWSMIKRAFTKRLAGRLDTPEPNRSRIKRREGTIWQRRFWEHKIRDESDLRAHVEYIHYNPVKHGLVAAPIEWKDSSFHKYVDEGLYPTDWGSGIIEFPGIIGQE